MMGNPGFNLIVERLRNKAITPDEAKVLFEALRTGKNNDRQSGDECAKRCDGTSANEIAVVGISGQFPDAPDVGAFWQNLMGGSDAVHELPARYLDRERYYSAERRAGRTYCTRGGILEDRDRFDPLFFSISPREAESMNPHQRLVLQESWKALEDAGYNPRGLDGSRVGVFIGAEPSDYFHETFTGFSDAIVASRLSYYLNLNGPALVVNTGCSSSGVAIHLACESLRNGESEIALAGGVLAAMGQKVLIALSQIEMLSPSGRCRTFDASGDGTVLSEGIGIVVLKRLADAVAAGDHIYGVIAGSGVNQDGASNGITAPNGAAQERLIDEVYRRYNIDPEDITYVEAHGTGTKLGDPVEANALVRAFRRFTGKERYCAVGSAKSNIGHTGAAAAAVGLIKILLSLRHRVIPGLINFEKMNPLIEFDGSPFYVRTEALPWKSGNGRPLTAALNSFGHSGTNVHLVIREYIPSREAASRPSRRPHPDGVLIPLSARNRERLKEYARRLLDFLRSPGAQDDPGEHRRLIQRGLERRLAHTLSSILGVREDEIEVEDAFVNYGVDPIHREQLFARVREDFGIEIPREETSLCDSLSALANCLSRRDPRALASPGGIFPADGIGREAGGYRSDIDLNAVAYTLQTGREAMEDRVVFLVRDVPELAAGLTSFLEGREKIERCWHGQAEEGRKNSSVFSSDEESDKRARAWISEGKLEKVAELWSRGGAVPWGALYDGQQPSRMSLPSYPFARERYWKPEAEGQGRDQGAEGGEANRVLNPLLHQNTSDLSEQRYSSTLTGREFFLADHIVQGQRVLPGVATLEMARAAVEQAAGGPGEAGGEIHLRNIGWVRPIVVRDKPVKVHVGLVPEEDGNLRYEIFSEPGEEDADCILHCRGSAAWNAPRGDSRLDLSALRSRCSLHVFESSDVYRTFQSAGISLGPAFRGVEKVYAGRNEALSKITMPPSVSNTGDRFVLHPSIMDSGLQTSIALMQSMSRALQSGHEAPITPSLPFALEELEVYGRCTPSMWAYVRYSEGSGANDRVQKIDLDLCDDEGHVRVRMKGFSSRVLEGEVGAAGSIGTVLASPFWKEQAVPEEAAVPAYANRHVLLCAFRGISGEEVGSKIPGARCITLEPQGLDIGQRFEYCAVRAFEEVQAILRDKPRERVLVQAVVSAEEEDRLLTGLSGLFTTASRENPKLLGQVIEIEKGATAQSLAETLQTDSRSPRDSRIRYRDGKRFVLDWKEETPEKESIPWKDNGVYLITGGAGGLGRIFAKEITGKVAKAVLILTGRTPLAEAKGAELRELETSGSRFEYHQLDVRDRSAAEDLIRSIRGKHGKLDGIIHAAGVIRDNFIIKKTNEEVLEVLGPKVTGLVNLDHASREEDLDFFILFSSLSGTLGNPGQADYSLANAFMDAYGEYRNALVAAQQRRGRTLSINWPLWKEGGMHMDEETEKMLFRTTGMIAMRTGSGIRALYQSLASGANQVRVVEGDVKRVRGTVLGQQAMPEAPRELVEEKKQTAVLEEDQFPEKAVAYFKKLLATVIKLPADRIDADAPMEKYGIDSIMVMQLTDQLEKVFGSLSKTLFFEYRDIRSLTGYFTEAHRDQLTTLLGSGRNNETAEGEKNRPEEAIKPATSGFTRRKHRRFSMPAPLQVKEKEKDSGALDIAIIGISGRYPQANTLREFWKNLRDGKDCITEVPKERWDHSLYFDEDRNKPGKTYSKWGGFIEGADLFDTLFFNIYPREAETIDPQERLFLQCAYETLEDAGYTRDTIGMDGGRGLKGSVGVYVGVMWDEYQLYGAQEQALGGSTALWGIPSSIANRVSYFCNFHGPSMAVNTMCSSSLTAIHLACQGLLRGECEAAVAGGVNVSIHPNKYLMLSQFKFASSTGRCESFGKGGDGYVPGEGVGAVLLKPLARAVSDGDHIYGIIKASAINHGGKTNGFSVPNPHAQAGVIARALKQAGIPPRTISYIEAHGTGTSLGDPIEIAGLARAFQEETRETGFCAIGSAKSNIGHCESAAGIAGVTKVLLQIKHGQLAPSLHAEVLNPNIDFSNSPFIVQRELGEWKRPVIDGRELPRRAGVSSFGAGGSNAHIVIEEYIPAEQREPLALSTGNPAVIVLSARNEDRLRVRAKQLLAALQEHLYSDTVLVDMAYTLQTGREAMDERLGMIVASVHELEEKLQAYLDGREGIEDLYRGQVKRNKEAMAAFASDEDAGKIIEAWIEKRKYGRLLEVWVRGLAVDWNKLYGADKPRRISLPPYPFARERYWVPKTRTPFFPADQKAIPMKAASPAEYSMIEKKTCFLKKQWEASPAASQERSVRTIAILATEETADLANLLSRYFPDSRILDGEDLHAGMQQSGEEWKSYDGCIDLAGCGTQKSESIRWIEWIQQLVAQGRRERVTLLCATSGLESHENGSINLAGASRAGLYRMLQTEYGHVHSRHMDADPALDREALAGQIASEFFIESDEPEVCYRSGIRYRACLREEERAGEEQDFAFPGNHVLLVTGGTRGLGYLCARHFVSRYGVRRLVLLGRESLPPREAWDGNQRYDEAIAGKIAAIRDLEREGAEVRVSSVGLTDEQAVRAFVLDISATFGPIGGVIHCAGAGDPENPAFIRKPAGGIQKILDPKVAGLDVLYRSLINQPLQFFLLFSSVSAAVPALASGQSDYAMANAYMDYFAEANKDCCSIISIQWPSWKESGMGEVKSRVYRETGLLSLTNAEGLELLDRVLSAKMGPVVMPALVDRARWKPEQLMQRRIEHAGPAPVQTRRSENVGLAHPDGLVSATQERLIDLFCRELKMDPSKLDADASFQDYGIDSVMLAQLLRSINELAATELDPSLLYEYPTIRSLAAQLVRLHRDALSATLGISGPGTENRAVSTTTSPPLHATAARPQPGLQQPRTESQEIAVVGMSCRFPGAGTVEEYWRLISEGRSAIRPVPADRWGYASDFYAGLVENSTHFDPGFFLLSIEDAQAMDPQACMALEESLKVWYHAGYPHREIKGKPVGVYLGARSQHSPDETSVFLSRNPIMAAGQNYLAANISQFFDLRGPSVVIDTACSSALVAMNMAIHALQSCEIESALVGGISLLNTDAPHRMFRRRGILNPGREFHIFDGRSGGVVLGEGAGMVLVKTLAKAREDGDQIYAIIRAMAINNDGRTAGPATPNLVAQKEVMEAALARSGRAAGDISYIEANGSGSEVTDLLELKAIQSVYRTSSDASCMLGSVKPNIGHPLCAEGIAGFIKVALMLRNRMIVPFLSGKQPMRHFDIDSSPFSFCGAATEWSGTPRVAAINCFADGGTNAHVILEEWVDPVPGQPRRVPIPCPELDRREIRSRAAAASQAVASSGRVPAGTRHDQGGNNGNGTLPIANNIWKKYSRNNGQRVSSSF